MKTKLWSVIIGFILLPSFIAAQETYNKNIYPHETTFIGSVCKPEQNIPPSVISSPDNGKADCLTCPSYDWMINPITSYQTHSSSIVSNGCRIYLLFVSANSNYTFKTGCGDGATAAFDTYLELYDGGCNYITGNDDGCENARSIITWTASYSGLAYLKVRGYNSSYFGAYTLAYKSDPWCLACPSYDFYISPGLSYQTHNSSISSSGCRYYAISVISGNVYTFKTGCGDGATADFDTFLELFNSSCYLIASDDDGCESTRSIITWTATYSGTAFLKIRGYNLYAIGNFTLAFRGINPSLCKICPSYDFSITPYSFYQTHISSIPSDGCKMYSFNVSSGRQYTFKTGCGDGATATFDTYLELLDGGCNSITYNDDGCESNRSIITWNATYSGTAYLKVRGYNSAAYGSYTLAYNEIQPPNLWLGSVNHQWENPSNWSLGHVPTANEDVFVTDAGWQPCYITVSNQECKSLEINPNGNLVIDNKELIINGTILNSGNLTMFNNSKLKVSGTWCSPGNFNPGQGKVEFFGNQSSYIAYYNESFNILEVNKTGVNTGLFISGIEVICQQYNWIQGGIYVNGYGVFNAYDLTDNGFFGVWNISENGTINAYNYGGWVDLNGSIIINGGYMNVYGGTTYSYWPYVGNAEIHITDGILDFKDQGIFINDNAPGYTLTENITGGTIRTSKGFAGNRSDFTPSGGTFEFYGTSDYLISQSNGCTLHNVKINKGAKEGENSFPEGPLTDSKSGMKISDGGKSNTITLDSDFTITGDLLIDWNSTLSLSGYNCIVSGLTTVIGILSMPNNTDFSSNGIHWSSGSQANINAGTFHVNYWIFGSGSMANIGAGNTAYVNGWISVDYCMSAFGSLVLEAASALTDNGSKAPTIMVNGNFTISTGSNWTFLISVEVLGDFYSLPNSLLIFDPKSLSVAGNATIAGYTGFYNGGTFKVEGNLNLISTGTIEMNGSYLNCLHPGIANLDGGLVMNTGSYVSFPERSVTIGPNFNDNGITGGTFQFGRSLYAPTAGTFQANLVNTEFISTSSVTDEIGLGTNNWLGNVLIQRSNYIELTGNLVIKGNLDITDNMLFASGKILTVEGTISVPHGNLSLTNGSQLIVGNSMNIGMYGLFETYGTSGNQNRVYGSSFGSYPFIVNSGGVIRGAYTAFEDMDVNGIWIKSGAIIDPASPLNYCTFKNGAAGGKLITIENTQSLTIQSPNFPVATGGGYNISKTSNSGIIEMNSATGAFAGPAFELDPYNRINWTGGMAGLWTGNVSSDWFNISNWSNFTVPTVNVSVWIPSGCPNYPVINGASGYCYNLSIDPGASLTIGNNKLEASNNIYIYGNLTMTNSSGTLKGNHIMWFAGSTDNVTAGAIRCNDFLFDENTLAKLSGTNTVYCAWATCYDYYAEFANLHLVPGSKKSQEISDSKTSHPIRVTGDFVMEPGSFFTPYSSIIVNLNSDIQFGAILGDTWGPELNMTCNGNLTIAGNMKMYYSSDILVHGNLNFTGYLTILPDCHFTCDYNSVSGWTTLNGTLDLYPGSDFKITGTNVLIGPSFNLIEQAPYPPYFNAGMTFGRSLSAPSPNFQVDHIYTSFTGSNTGHYINMNASNYLLSFAVNKYPGGDFYLQSNLTVKDFIYISAATTLKAYDKTLTVGGNWTEDDYWPPAGDFEPMTGMVIFNGSTDQTIVGQTEFNILEVNKPAGRIIVPAGSSAECQSYNYTAGGIRVDGGTFTALDIIDDRFNGNNEIISGTLNIGQDALQTLGLSGNLTISGGVMNVTSMNGSFYWGFYENCHVAMNNGEMIVNAPEGLAIPGNYTGVFSENITGGTIRIYNELDVINTAFTPTGGTIEFVGPGTTIVGMNPSSNVFNLLINKTGTGDFGLLSKEGSENDSKTNEVRLFSDLQVNGALTVAKGLLDLNGYDIRVNQSVMVTNGGTLEVDAGASLLMAANQTLAVTEGGILNVIGSAGNEARVSRVSTGNYHLSIEQGGTIGAQHGIFEYMSTNGIYLKSGSLVDASFPFNNCTFLNGISGGRLLTVSNTQTFTVNNAIFPANTWGGSYNVYKTSSSGQVNFVGATGGFSGAAFEYDPNNLVNWSSLNYSLSLKAFLEGPFNGTNMNTTLNGILPLSHPFNPSLPYFNNPLPDWYYSGAGSVSAIPNANIVDWVLIELRDAVNAASATKATMIGQYPAFILNNGAIVALDGASNLQFSGTVLNNLYIVVYHRNHLSIMNANLIPLVSGTYSYDYTTGASQVFGGNSGHKELASGKWGMRSGDGNGDGEILLNDKTQVWGINTQLGKTGYLPSDFNFDRQTNNKDKNDKCFPNLGTCSLVPN